MNKVAAFALRRKNSILSMSEKMFCPPQPLRFWITPACAGKRRSDWIIRSIYWDHPRMCGEKDKAKEMGATTKGSPPRMRGKAQHPLFDTLDVGITPACAGKRCRSPAFRSMPWDHPRMCGEKVPITCVPKYALGSPPHVRGKAFRVGLAGRILGITPAHAGKRSG